MARPILSRAWSLGCCGRSWVRRRRSAWERLSAQARAPCCGRGNQNPSNGRVARPIVAIVGRPNVGKSTLFNRLIGWKKAIVDAESGLTRDRLYGIAEWRGREFSVVDTAGLDLDTSKDSTRAAIEAQTKIAIEQADVIVLLLDVRQGLTPIDRDIAHLLRKSMARPLPSGRQAAGHLLRERGRVLVAANKADSPGQAHLAHELLELGFAGPSLISAQHGLGVGE